MQSNSDSLDSVQSAGHLASHGPKLSLVAQFDDMCRFANSLITVDEQCIAFYHLFNYISFNFFFDHF